MKGYHTHLLKYNFEVFVIFDTSSSPLLLEANINLFLLNFRLN